MNWLTDPQIWIAFLTLVALELVLGVDNVIFITILTGVRPEDQRPRARTLGLGTRVRGNAKPPRRCSLVTLTRSPVHLSRRGG